MYASYDYYEERYLMDTEPVIPEDDFQRWERQAERILDQRTFGRLASNPALITASLKDCVCELAELLYQGNKVSLQAAEQGGGILTSFSNDGESGTYDLSQSAYTEEGRQKKIREIIYRYLGITGLLYSGV